MPARWTSSASRKGWPPASCRPGACRVDHCSANISPKAVNYDGNYPYAGGEKGLNRKQTVPVKSLLPNAWGLYQMHGNVWEWCADGLRRYDGLAQQDPKGPVLEGPEARRAVRGGSWIDDANRARSACRFAGLPGHAFDHLGFRLCLRSIEPGQAPGRSGGRAGALSPPRDEAGLARVKRKLRDWLRPDRKR